MTFQSSHGPVLLDRSTPEGRVMDDLAAAGGSEQFPATSVGHTGAAHGLVRLARAVLALYQQIEPPLDAAPERAAQGPGFWLRDRVDGPRHALIECAGVGGGCVRVVLREHEGPESAQAIVERSGPFHSYLGPGNGDWLRSAAEVPVPLAWPTLPRQVEKETVLVERSQPLGARSRALFVVEADESDALLRSLDRLEGLAATCPEQPIEAIARRWWAGSPNDPAHTLGLAFVTGGGGTELRALVAAARRRVEGRDPGAASSPVAFSTEPLGRSGQLALVYPGIGNSLHDVGPALSAQWPEVFRGLDAGTLRLRGQLHRSDWYAGQPGPPDDHRAPILGQIVMGMAVTDLLASFGVRPDAVIGYSLGESAALFATRTWSERDAMHDRLEASPLFRNELAGPCDAARRAWKLGPDEPVDWTAALVGASVDDVRAALRDLGLTRVYPLIVNTPRETVIGGQRASVARLVEALSCPALPLPVVSTVHCAIAREVEQAYRDLHLLTTTPPPDVRFYSAAWGRAYVPDRATAAEAIVAQALDTVDFPAVVRRAYDDGVRLFVEAGPGASCTRMIRSVLDGRPHLAQAACVAGNDAVGTLLGLLARLIAERVPVDLRPLYGQPTRAVGLDPDWPAPSRRVVTVPVGGRPFDVPTPPSPIVTAPQPVRHSIVENSPVQSQPWMGGSEPGVAGASCPSLRGIQEPGASQTPPEPPGQFATPADPITAQLLATGEAEARTHEAYLRVAEGLGQTIAGQLSYQMALIEALMVGRQPSLDGTEHGVAGAECPGLPDGRDTGASKTPPQPPGSTDQSKIVAPPTATVLDRDQCLEFAVGSIGKVLGAAFAAIDVHPTRVRLPDEPLMLVDRITAIEGEPRQLTSGRVVTEHDIVTGAWYLDCGKIPPCIAIESGQADLFLSGWLGIDFETEGQAVYRLLDAAVTFHRGLPGPGEVIRYDIRISRFFRQGETILFRFEFDGTVGGAPLLTMRDGCAGFFTAEELSAGQGIVRRPLDLRPLPGQRPDDWSELVPMAVESYDDAQVEALRRGDHAAAFGPAFAGLGLVDPLRLPGGRMTLLHRVALLDPSGGRYGLGLIRSTLDIHPGDWFLTCHFVDDPVMPGTLMYECCLHALRIYLTRMGWVAESAGVAYEPVPGLASRLRCRGQVIESTRQAVFEVVIKELGYGPEPYAIADAMMYADGKAIVEVVDMTLRLTGLTRSGVEGVWKRRVAGAESETSHEDRGLEDSNPATQPIFTRAQVLAFATGKPSDAFGERYRPFDEGRFVARLPAPPYSFLDRVVSATARALVMKPGGGAVAEFDVPPDAWFFTAERRAVMPFAVLQEVALQACGWLAAYMGSALTSDDDLAFRNLGGEVVVLADVTPETGTLTTRVTVTKVSHSGGMILQHYDFETTAGPVPVYRGSTYFGFFRRAALADQVGIREAAPYRPTVAERARARSFAYPTDPPFPDRRLRMIDRVEAYVADGGPHGLGLIVGALDVDPSAWFFAAHFHHDPVCPGSLGLESFLQLLKVVACERWAGAGQGAVIGFEPAAHGVAQRWLYRGQVVPVDRTVTVQAVVTGIDEERRRVTADGHLSVDGRVIYEMNGFSLRLLI
jgi:3-hydroxymyristoyl/3-hydroxydecanoyl-(acyl carrier protein) dehydratase